MIKKIIDIKKDLDNFDDKVELSWFDMQKPNLSAITKNGVEFIIKVKFTHLHENDFLVDEDDYKIKVSRCEDEIYILKFDDVLTFAKTAYEIGNRHQPIMISDFQITALEDISILDIIKQCQSNEKIDVNKTKGYFKPNGKAHHSH
ncbi:urease accessory protein UreE [Malaciobacter molluscorum LMG 25693]|uniref:Urease accessory protein UreE n=1 Tax=Malaciobacter molluscorum LMG 25693 TaxID=870501 RepID=A0A2G1DJB9_9BACT|nr:urease accessory protein UreE [Malaciobacter molluscorum]AXX91608.1 urease accessory protein UreE [Malaciobacter molluscorum LMG 25693]PHO18597.1 urease accessory protein UreE [Malaciobacter molluscorum LMG 25693]